LKILTGKKQELGTKGENLAVSYLLEKGFRIIARNFRCRLGEIDIIAQKGDYLVFVEVRTRSSRAYGLAQESISRAKVNKLRQLAEFYLAGHPRQGLFIRFDVVAVDWFAGAEITHIENAF